MIFYFRPLPELDRTKYVANTEVGSTSLTHRGRDHGPAPAPAPTRSPAGRSHPNGAFLQDRAEGFRPRAGLGSSAPGRTARLRSGVEARPRTARPSTGTRRTGAVQARSRSSTRKGR